MFRNSNLQKQFNIMCDAMSGGQLGIKRYSSTNHMTKMWMQKLELDTMKWEVFYYLMHDTIATSQWMTYDVL